MSTSVDVELDAPGLDAARHEQPVDDVGELAGAGLDGRGGGSPLSSSTAASSCSIWAKPRMTVSGVFSSCGRGGEEQRLGLVGLLQPGDVAEAVHHLDDLAVRVEHRGGAPEQRLAMPVAVVAPEL